MKVLQVGKYYPPARGGIETHLEQLSEELEGKVELEVIVSNHERGEARETRNGVRVRRVNASANIAGAPICLGLPRAIREADADIVHIHTPHPTALLSYLASRARGHLVCTYHSDIIRQRVLGHLLGPLQHAAYARAKAILVSSPNLLAGSPVLSRHRERCVVVPFGLRPSRICPGHEKEVDVIRQRFGGPILLAVGRLVYYKGFEVLIEAMSRLQAPARLLIIGEGPLKDRLQTQIGTLGLVDRVHLLGNVPDTAPYYQACDLLVLPSIARSEAFGLVQLEAMACSKPVINTSIAGSGVPFVSRHGETGLTVPPGDAAALAGAIMRLLGNEHLRMEFGRAGKRRVAETFSIDGMARHTLQIYDQVMSGIPASS